MICSEEIISCFCLFGKIVQRWRNIWGRGDNPTTDSKCEILTKYPVYVTTTLKKKRLINIKYFVTAHKAFAVKWIL